MTLRRRGEHISEPVIASGALAIAAMGAFWFFQRIMA